MSWCRGVVASLALWISGCADADLPVALEPEPRAETTSPLVVSEPTTAVAAGASLAVAATTTGPQTYVAMPPGSVPRGVTAVITNARRDARVTEFMFGGGFDPASIAAEAGDTLRVVVRGISGEQLVAATAVVPVRRKPTILRTSPPPKKRDVPLNAVITVVFSEPMDAQTLSTASVRVVQGNVVVAGDIVVDATGTHVEFRPQTLLQENTTYTVSLQSGIADASADLLDAASFEFSTVADGSTTGMSELAFAGCTMGVDGIERCGLFVAAADGSQLSARTSSEGRAGWDSSPTWSPDALRIAFTSWRHCIAESRVPQSVPGGECPRELYVMNADGSGIQRITDMDTTGGFRADFPAWSPDGTEIVFIADRFGSSPASTIRSIRPDGSGMRIIRESSDLMFGRVTWSPDGARMALSVASRTSSSLDVTGIHVMNADGSGLEQITGWLDGFASWSPDGTRIAFQRRYEITEDDVMQTWHHVLAVDPDGANEVQLTPGFGASVLLNLTPTWSPNGTRIAYVHTTIPRQLRVMKPDGSDIREVIAASWTMITLPAWSPVGIVPP